MNNVVLENKLSAPELKTIIKVKEECESFRVNSCKQGENVENPTLNNEFREFVFLSL